MIYPNSPASDQSRVHDVREIVENSPGLVSESNKPAREGSQFFRFGRHLPYVDAGTLSYTTGLVGAALFMAMSIGPGWLGFVVSYLPMSMLTTLAAATHE